MTWFLTREEAEELLLSVERVPDYTYQIEPNGCGPEAWGIMVLDADGVLVTEAYTPGDIFPLRQVKPVSEAEYREIERTHRTRHEGAP